MSSLKELKQRIANVSSTQQLIKAMDIVASTKLQRVRTQLERVRPIYRQLKRIVEEAGERPPGPIFYAGRELKNSVYRPHQHRGSPLITLILAKAGPQTRRADLVVPKATILPETGEKHHRKIIDLPDAQATTAPRRLPTGIDLYRTGV